MKRILTNPIILTFALIEFCTGVLRNGVMHWFPFYVKEVWALPGDHPLQNGSWSHWEIVIALFAIAAVLGVLASFSQGKRRTWLVLSASAFGLLPFLQAGWGGLLMVAGVIGANVAGRVSDFFFQSRRAPAAGGLYLVLTVCAIGMCFTLGATTNRVGWSKGKGGFPLQVGDEVLSVAGKRDFKSWSDVSEAIACVPSQCQGSGVRWDAKLCLCSSRPKEAGDNLPASTGLIFISVLREGKQLELAWKDPLTHARAGDRRALPAGPVLALNPYWLGLFVFLVSLCVIGTHGLLSGTATMDFGGRRAAATAVGLIDGFVYLGTAFQGLCLGYLTTQNWVYWPLFLLPFAVIGFILLTRLWHAKPRS